LIHAAEKAAGRKQNNQHTTFFDLVVCQRKELEKPIHLILTIRGVIEIRVDSTLAFQ
jgi:hypothetical protein